MAAAVAPPPAGMARASTARRPRRRTSLRAERESFTRTREEWPAATLKRAHAVHPISAVQSEYSLWTRDPEADGILDACAELGAGFLAYSPLGRGFLTGQLKRFEDFEADDYRRLSPRFQGENFQKNLDLVQRVGALAAAHGVTPAQLALAWLLARRPFVVPIPGSKRRRNVEENAKAVDVVLGPDEIAALDAVFPLGAAVGDRYPAAMMANLAR